MDKRSRDENPARLAGRELFKIAFRQMRRFDESKRSIRPLFDGDPSLLRWRRPGDPLDPRLLEAFRQPLIGQTGDLPRNAGRGPSLFTLDLTLAREFKLGERTRLRPTVEFDNVLNKTVFTFGAEFVNFYALRDDATAGQRRAFLDTFLVPTRTLRPRAMRAGLRLDF